MLPGIEWRLFLAAWIAYAGFHQGGGWSQNARFAQVRAIAEQGRLDVDAYLVYAGVRDAPRGPQLVRAPVAGGLFEVDGRRYALTWPDGRPLVGELPAGAAPAPLERVAASGDVAFAGGRLFPNKAPGTTWLAVPAYLAIHRLWLWRGVDPDDWWALTLAAWLSTALGVGLASAAGCVLLRRAALRLWPEAPRAATGAALAFAFATPFFPYATLFFEQAPAAVALLAAFDRLCAAPGLAAGRARTHALAFAGLAAGAAVATSYLAALALPFLLLYLARGEGGLRGIPAFAAGLAPPLALLAAYHQACFGSPFATAYAFQNPLFLGAAGWRGVFDAPEPLRLVAVLVSPYRGLFFHAPVLLAGAAALVAMALRPGRRAEAALFAAILAAHLLFNASFHAWHAGWGVGPRYLVPALPFLALPLAPAFARAGKTTAALAVLSAAAMLAFTAVDAQPSVGSSPIAERPDRSRLWREPLGEYALPILWSGRAGPILEAQGAGPAGAERPLAHFRGPVSANPIGVYEAWIGTRFRPPAPELAWNSFNAGELLLPGRRASLGFLLVPLALAISALRASPPRARAG